MRHPHGQVSAARHEDATIKPVFCEDGISFAWIQCPFRRGKWSESEVKAKWNLLKSFLTSLLKSRYNNLYLLVPELSFPLKSRRGCDSEKLQGDSDCGLPLPTEWQAMTLHRLQVGVEGRMVIQDVWKVSLQAGLWWFLAAMASDRCMTKTASFTTRTPWWRIRMAQSERAWRPLCCSTTGRRTKTCKIQVNYIVVLFWGMVTR